MNVNMACKCGAEWVSNESALCPRCHSVMSALQFDVYKTVLEILETYQQKDDDDGFNDS